MRAVLMVSFVLGLAIVTLSPAATHHPHVPRTPCSDERTLTVQPPDKVASILTEANPAPPRSTRPEPPTTFDWLRVPQDPVRLRIALAHAALADDNPFGARTWAIQAQYLDLPNVLLEAASNQLYWATRKLSVEAWMDLAAERKMRSANARAWKRPLRPRRYAANPLDRFVDWGTVDSANVELLDLLVCSAPNASLAYVPVGPGPWRRWSKLVMVGMESARDLLETVTAALDLRWELHGGMIYVFHIPIGRRVWRSHRVETEAVADVALRSLERACWELDPSTRFSLSGGQLHVFHFPFVHERIERALKQVRAAARWFGKDARSLLERAEKIPHMD